MNYSTVNSSSAKNSTEPFLEDIVYSCEFTMKFRTISIVISLLIIVTVCFGNTLILVTLKRFTYQFKGVLYILIGNLAVADLLLAVGYSLHLAAFASTNLGINTYVCVIKTCFVSLSVICSIKIIMCMSLDRFCAIVLPMKHLIKSNQRVRRRIIIGFVWISSIAVACTPIIWAALSKNGTRDSYCNFGDFVPSIISLIASIGIPIQFLINLSLCIVVIWRIKTNPISVRKYNSSINKCSIMLKVYFIYLLSWTPFIVLTFMVETTAVASRRQTYFCAREKAVLIGCLNSGMNWIIYGLCNPKFRMSFKDVLLCRKGRNKQIRVQFSSVAKSDQTKPGTNFSEF